MTIQTEPEVTEQTTTDPSKYAHICKKSEIPDGYILGTELEALCGYKFIPSQNPEKLPVCPPCKAVFEDDEARDMAAGWRSP